MSSTTYGASSIRVLKGLEGVRHRPDMYIGSTDKAGLHHCVWEVIDNSRDEAIGGFADLIEVTLHKDNSVTVSDNGRGIPVTMHPEEKKPTIEVVFTNLHAGGKFTEGAYQTAGGLHGVGVKAVNALSKWLTVEVTRDGAKHRIGFGIKKGTRGKSNEYGATISPLEQIGKAPKKVTGTQVHFLLDEDVFKNVEVNGDLIAQRLKETSFLTPGLRTILHDERGTEPTTREFHFPGGLVDFMTSTAAERLADSDHEDLADRVLPLVPIHLTGSEEAIGSWDMCLQWYPDTADRVSSYANGINTPDGGTHVDGFQRALTMQLNRYANQEHIALLREGEKLEAADVRSGRGVIIAVKVRNPKFHGQTKSKLNNEEVATMVRSGVNLQFAHWMEEHPAETEAILNKLISEMRLRKKLAEEAEKDRQAANAGMAPRMANLPTKLKDASSKDRSVCELFLVEGNSAEGPALAARDPKTQAILPLRGKVLNVQNEISKRHKERRRKPVAVEAKGREKKKEDPIYENAEIVSIVNAVDAGAETHFDLAAARYDKIIILTDADDDGRHIQCLLMALFHHLMRPLVEAGRLYVARTPLYATTINDQAIYVYTLEERQAIEEQYPRKQLTWSRFKGLGEMDPEELGIAALHPDTRTLVRVVIDEDSDADTAVRLLMGDGDDASAAKREAIRKVSAVTSYDEL